MPMGHRACVLRGGDAEFARMPGVGGRTNTSATGTPIEAPEPARSRSPVACSRTWALVFRPSLSPERPCQNEVLRPGARQSPGVSGAPLQDVDRGGRPWPVRTSVCRILARRSLEARIQTIFFCSVSDLGCGHLAMETPKAVITASERVAEGHSDGTRRAFQGDSEGARTPPGEDSEGTRRGLEGDRKRAYQNYEKAHGDNTRPSNNVDRLGGAKSDLLQARSTSHFGPSDAFGGSIDSAIRGAY